jgi:hypothetical protein
MNATVTETDRDTARSFLDAMKRADPQPRTEEEAVEVMARWFAKQRERRERRA